MILLEYTVLNKIHMLLRISLNSPFHLMLNFPFNFPPENIFLLFWPYCGSPHLLPCNFSTSTTTASIAANSAIIEWCANSASNTGIMATFTENNL